MTISNISDCATLADAAYADLPESKIEDDYLITALKRDRGFSQSPPA